MGHTAMAAGIAGIDFGPLTQFASLAALPFAHEDLAIVLGAYIVVNEMLPIGLVLLAIYGGMVVSDFALYGIGAGARHLPWLQRYAVDDRIDRFGDLLRRNIFAIVTVCRLVPGLVFIAFIACGWMRVSLARFTVASLLVSALYLPLMLYLVVVFGDALDNHLGVWTWPLLLVVLFATGFVRRRILAFSMADAEPAHAAAPRWLSDDFAGLPALDGLSRKVAAAERIPPLLFYIPLVLNWALLGLRHRSMTLPSAANPRIPTGGMWGESKSACLADIRGAQRDCVADFVVVRRRADDWTLPLDAAHAMRLMTDAHIVFPVVAKPDIGWHGYGVRLIETAEQLQDYLGRFPAGAKVILQRYVEWPGEAAILYARKPGASHGRIESLTLRYFPHVIGDGCGSVADLIARDPRARWKSSLHLGYDESHNGLGRAQLKRVPERGEVVRVALIGNQRAGGLYRDATAAVTPELAGKIDAVAASMSEFHYGRFDIRFDSIGRLLRGDGFSIVEVNGIGGEAIDAWDPDLSVIETYRRMLSQQRLLFEIGAANRARGFKPTGKAEFLAALVRQTQLIRRYPASS